MEHYSQSMDLPVSEMHIKMAGQVSGSPESQLFYSPMTMSSNIVFSTPMLSNNGVEHSESPGGGIAPSPIYIPDNLGGNDANMMNNAADRITPLAVKRKAEVGPLVHNSISPRSMLPNKRPAHIGSDVSSARFLQPSAPQRKTAAATQPGMGSQGTPLQNSQNKKMVRNDSTAGKSGLQRGPARKQATKIDSASKARPESTEAVRSKMRESLAGALALAVHKQENVLNAEKNQSEAASTHPTMGTQTSEAADNSKELSTFSTTNELRPDGISGNGGEAFQGFQFSSILPEEDVTFGDNFFAKDDLLQGNGLTWAFDFDAQMGEQGKESQNDEKLNHMKEEEAKAVPVLTPENLAFEIEAELFKLFGGVNKKYREKARSLLFNLKDRNNPDLRVSVMSGEISPEKLCSMSAEELASKELSQWRMAKAEEFAQMVVLPDTEVDVRRLVKKTHKGEYQVEMDHNDDDIAAEVSSGTSMLTRAQPKKVTAPQSPSKASPKDRERVAGQGNTPEDQDFSGFVIPTDGTDLMQGMIVDELKDAELLPPIVSLDEFMESLNNEPPFEDLSGDAGLKIPGPHGESPKPVRNSQGVSSRASKSPNGISSKKAGVFNKHDRTEKSNGSPAKPKNLPSSNTSKDEYIWNGTLQLHSSSSVTVGGLFQSGEKTSTKKWPTTLEIKGRVRLDAFEKFLQELPMSRTRAVMVLQYILKDTSSETQHSNLSEAIDSYTKDERLGYAEPASGVELYLCPGTPRILDTLSKLIPKENPETKSAVENGLIGVVVWRRAHSSNRNVSPNSTSHHKHSSKKQPLAPPPPHRAHNTPNVIASNNKTPTRTPPPGLSTNRPEPEKDEEDDVPPGFGPGSVARKDDDDLPEFNFSGNLQPLNPTPVVSSVGAKMTHRPIDQVRELIKKYGQDGTSVNSIMGRVDNKTDISSGIEPWDDDDDIPEWQPQGLQPPYAVARGQSNLVTSNQHGVPLANPQQPHGGPGRGGRWVQPPGQRWRPY